MDVRLRVGLVLDGFDPARGGLELWVLQLAIWLRDRGHRVTIVAFSATHREPGLEFALAEAAYRPLDRAARLAATLTNLDLDLVHDTGSGYRADVFQPQVGSRLVNGERDVAALPFTARWRARLSPGRRTLRREFVQLETRQFADPAKLIAVSGQVRDSIAARYGVDAGAITVIPNGVDTSAFDPARLRPRRATARKAWNLNDRLVFLVVARNFRLKGVDTAIRALHKLKAKLPQAHLLVVGSGDAAPYRALAAQLDVETRVTFTGRVHQIEDACAAADVALQPTRHDACSLATLEGLASGLPTITTSVNGAGELMTSGVEGFIINRPDDAARLAAAMAAMASPDVRAAMGRAARRLSEGHDVAVCHEAIEAFYWRRIHARNAPALQPGPT